MTDWTPQKIYKHPLPGTGNRMPPVPDGLMYTNPAASLVARLFTDEFIKAYREEKNWGDFEGEEKKPTAQQAADIMAGQPCPICEGPDGYYRTRTGESGIQIAVQWPCQCAIVKRFRDVWTNPKIIPRRYQHIRFSELRAQDPDDRDVVRKTLMSLKDQEKILAILRQYPDDSWLFTGDAGCGKTYFSMALFERHLRNWAIATYKNPLLSTSLPILHTDTKTMLDQHHNWATQRYGDETPAPDITLAKIKALAAEGHRVILFLDGFDKFGPTEFRMNTLHRLVNAIYLAEGRIIAVSNASVFELKKKWKEFSAAEAILQRITEPEAHGRILRFGYKRKARPQSLQADYHTTK